MYLGWNGGWNYFHYVQLASDVHPDGLRQQFPAFMERHINSQLREYGVQWNLEMQKLKDVHLFSKSSVDLSTKGNVSNIYIFGATAFIILMLACINFMNLTTAQAAKRSKEIGIRKVTGAVRMNLVVQFMVESVVVTLSALVLASALLFLTEPWLIKLLGNKFQLSAISWSMILVLTGLLVLVTIVFCHCIPHSIYHLSNQ